MLLSLDDHLFPRAGDLVYLNTASVAPLPRPSEQALLAWQRDLARSGTLHFDEVAERTVFDRLRRAAARLLGTKENQVAVAASATDLLSSLAWAVMPAAETNIVSSREAFPSTVYPWARVARHTGAEVRLVGGRNDGTPTSHLVEAIDSATSVVCVSHVEYGSGRIYDLGLLAEAAHRHDALLVVDATQSAGVIPLEFDASGVDALVTSGYKWLCGPFGVALLALAPELIDTLDPGTIGFRSHTNMWELEAGRLELPPSARRFEASTMNYGCAIALAISIEIMLDIGVDAIRQHDLALADLLIEELPRHGAHLESPTSGGAQTPIVSARLPGVAAPWLAEALKRNRVVISPRGHCIRFAPHLFNTQADIECAMRELALAAKHSPSLG